MDKMTQEQIKAWVPLGHPAVAIAHTTHPELKRFEAFARKWQELSTNIVWQVSSQTGTLPGFFLSHNILYSALPLERELPPFLNGLDALDTPHPVPPDIQSALEKLRSPCRLTLYIALHCPHCPKMVEVVIPLAAASKTIDLHIIDGALFPENAQNDNVLSAPCLILDDDIRWTGAVGQEEIVEMIANKAGMGLDTPALKIILEDGRAEWIAQRMLESGCLFKGFAGLILHETWSVRLGAMVVVETLAGKAPALCADLENTLVAAFSTSALPVQGDILYALGEIGTPDTREWIAAQQPALSHDDLKDAAVDAIQSIEEKFSS